ncbi:MAG TPA: MarC family protein, partial [Flavobacteriales bacterium]|nr:MarC family protein [Flavobacteriales bacterium]
MVIDLEQLLKSTMVLFAVIDIVGSIPILMDVQRKSGNIHPGRATLVALGIMLA